MLFEDPMCRIRRPYRIFPIIRVVLLAFFFCIPQGYRALLIAIGSFVCATAIRCQNDFLNHLFALTIFILMAVSVFVLIDSSWQENGEMMPKNVCWHFTSHGQCYQQL